MKDKLTLTAIVFAAIGYVSGITAALAWRFSESVFSVSLGIATLFLFAAFIVSMLATFSD